MKFLRFNKKNKMGALMKRHPLFRFSIITSIVLVVLQIILPIWKLFPYLGGLRSLPLHYNIYFGVDLVGPWYKIFYLPILGVILFVANTFFEVLLYQKEHILSYFFAVGTVFAEFILLVAILLITLLNL